MRPGAADVISIDLPWGHGHGRTAIASRSPEGIAVAAVVDDDELVEYVQRHAATNALVLLDVPVAGCEALNATNPRRGVDDRCQRIGIPILPSVKAGMRGPQLTSRLLGSRPDLRIFEGYPYAVLRVIWGLHLQGRPFRFDDDAATIDLSAQWRSWPPKYKRASTVANKLVAMREVASVISRLPGFESVVVDPTDAATGMELTRLADNYDALLGLVAGIAGVEELPWSWLITTSRDAGAILTIADGSLRRRFAAGDAG